MKKHISLLSILFIINILAFSQNTGHKLSGSYLGQTPPGETPELFAPGIISTIAAEGCSGWGNEMEFFIFNRRDNKKARMYITHQKNGVWSNIEPIPIFDKYNIGDFTIAPDGKTLYFASNLHIDEFPSDQSGANIWFSTKTKNAWTEPKHIGAAINTKYHDSYPCVSNNKNLYFFSRKPGGYGVNDLYMSEYFNGKYQAPVNMGSGLNTSEHEWDPYIAPDESYMIYCSMMPGSLGNDDLFITFRNMDGSWSKPIHLGDKINSTAWENRPYVSPDGKYLFYASTVSGQRDIYWVDMKAIFKLRPSEVKPLFPETESDSAQLFKIDNYFDDFEDRRRSFNFTISPNQDEMFFSYIVSIPNSNEITYVIKHFKLIDGKWSGPEVADFSKTDYNVDINFSPDGKYIFFASDRSEENTAEANIYYCKKENGKWSEPISCGVGVNSMGAEVYPSLSNKNNLFFRSTREGSYGSADLYKAEWRDGKFINVQNMGPNINTEYHESNSVVAPDESYILFCSARPETDNVQQIWISFQTSKNVWSKAQRLDSRVNRGNTGAPTLTTDGKYMLFRRDRQIYWIKTDFIQDLKPNRK